MAGVLLDREKAQELVEYQRQHGRDHRSRKPHRASGPILTARGGITDWVRVSSTTLDGQGYYPGFTQSWNPDTKVWSDVVACQIAGPSLDTLTASRYFGRRYGLNSTSGKPVYIVTLGSGSSSSGISVQYDDGSFGIAGVLTLKVKKADFLLTGTSPTATLATKGYTGSYLEVTGITCATTGISVTTQTITVTDGLTQSVT